MAATTRRRVVPSVALLFGVGACWFFCREQYAVLVTLRAAVRDQPVRGDRRAPRGPGGPGGARRREDTRPPREKDPERPPRPPRVPAVSLRSRELLERLKTECSGEEDVREVVSMLISEKQLNRTREYTVFIGELGRRHFWLRVG